MNLRTLAVTTALVCISAPSWAWTNTNNGHNNQIVDGGPGAQANQSQGQRQRQGQSQTATGGRGGAGGAATASGGAAAGGTASINGSYGGSVNSNQAPSVFVSPPAAGGQCGIVGFGVGGSGLGGGGGFGPSWESTNCRAYYNAELLASWGDIDAARSLLRATFSDVDKAYGSATTAPMSPIATKPEYCTAGRGWSEKQLAARYQECRAP